MPCGRTAFWPAFGCPAGTSEGSPQARATLPSVSNSITGGEALDLNAPPRVPVFVSAPPTPSGEARPQVWRQEEHTSELQSLAYLSRRLSLTKTTFQPIR